ncbi:CAP domain-containing protein [Deinococcus sp. Marseille-Q6407]|uniref:CAP domain-containing protein n=1 Tax=Deinococcus sp. Marseille-Q6407 TaxID=2969223 RepID=UPI0021C19AE1|nr:CAP domain-containing protein [Deinococcus sp. Marseille-Q6407]
MRPLSRTAALLTCAAGVLLSLVPAAAQEQFAQEQFQVSAETDSQRLAPLTVNFRAQVSSGTDVRWNFGDGQAAQGRQVTHTYYQPGHYVAAVNLSRGRLPLGQSQLPIEVKSQGQERAKLVVLLGLDNVLLSDVGSVVYRPYQPHYSLNGQALDDRGSGRVTAALQPGTNTASLSLSGVGGPLKRSVSFTLPSSVQTSAVYEDQVLRAINLLRTSRYNCATGRTDGVARAPLTRSRVLDRAALAQALAMPAAGFVNHVSELDGSSPAQRIAAAGYPNANTAENLAVGQPTPAEAVSDWLNSPGHCASIMGDYTETGLSYVRVPGSEYLHHWVQEFGKPQRAAAAQSAKADGK